MSIFDSFRAAAFGAPSGTMAPRADMHTTARPIPRKKKIEAGEITRLSASWAPANMAADEEVRRSLEKIRARSRDLSYNNEYARKFLQMVATHIVGPAGFTLQALAADGQKPDRLARDAIESAFYQWGQRGICEATGRMGFAELQRLVVETVARDGEALLLRRRGADNAFGYELKLVEIDRLPVHKNDTLKGGNKIVMGVELNADGRAVAYWLNMGELETATAQTVSLTRIPADDVIHLYRPGRPEQHRGLPWMHPVMTGLKMLAGYEEAAIVAARVGAAKMGFYTSPDGTADPLADDHVEGEFYQDAEAGAFSVLPPGYKFESWDPDYPHQGYEAFVKSRLRSIASGLGIAYHTLANDLADVNYSSARAGTIEERDNWIVLQNWLVDGLLRPVFNDWLAEALKKGAIVMAMGSALPVAKAAKWGVHEWQGRRWTWVDPLKDIEAAKLAISSGLASPYSIAAQQGLDLADVIDAIASANKLAAAAGLAPYAAPEAPPAPAPAPPPDNALREMTMAALARSMEPREDKPMVVNVNNAPITVNTPEVRNDIVVQPAEVTPPAIHNEITVQPAEVQIAAPEIRNVIEVQPADVTLEAQINVPPPEVRVHLPNRKTETTIERDTAGNIIGSSQIEIDAE
jgi:lambda family phage portal protein